ncbi:hypothetical protein GCM10007079_46730 [Nocardiopsis terrae]|uniref:Uncharacterized protein n=1 Tax=Nocardiopsis terrae TaxID=372655 RepID=A0ABR9HKK3_9ACTN|nr:hypothetical protein [Nocardiopsis terrae]MBE1459518.1 hypothetical protein [Nocardiopsis terrae]GHC95237.1 hypothetical protein GCM10007079_46730 [Nocardiopsis terrae]
MATFARTRLVAVIVVLTVPAVLFPLVGPWVILWLPFALMLLGAALARPAPLDAVLEAALGLVTGGGSAGDGKDEDVRVSGQDLRGRSDRPDRGDEPGPVEAPRGESGTRGVRTRRTELPSALDDYVFEFSALVHWRWAHRVDLSLRNPAGPAVHSIVLRARDILCEVHPDDRSVTESELGSVFAVEAPVAGGTIQVWADEVRLELSDEDDERLRRMARLRKDRALWTAEHEAARDRAAVSGEPGRALPSELLPEPRLHHAGHEDPDVLGLSDLEPPEPDVPMPGSGVDEEGYESYWWPAEQETDEGADSMEQDVQVAILRGLIDSVEDGAERAAFVREQVDILERTGFGHVAERIQSVYPEQ